MNKGFGRNQKNQKRENNANSAQRTTSFGNRPGVEYRKVSNAQQSNIQSNPQRGIQNKAQNSAVRKPITNNGDSRRNNTRVKSVNSPGRIPQINNRFGSVQAQNPQNSHTPRNNAPTQAERRAELARKKALEVQRRRTLGKKRVQLFKNLVSQAAAV